MDAAASDSATIATATTSAPSASTSTSSTSTSTTASSSTATATSTAAATGACVSAATAAGAATVSTTTLTCSSIMSTGTGTSTSIGASTSSAASITAIPSAPVATVGSQAAPLLLPSATPPSPVVGGGGVLNLPSSIQQQSQPSQLPSMDDVNSSYLASSIAESHRSISAAPSASSSPILSPPAKIFGRNANGTLVATSRPCNEAEMQLYRVLQRASLLIYYDTLLEMGGDDVQQLYEAGEEEFLEIMALVGMASKPLHVRRLQKALHEWANNPQLFQGLITPSPQGLHSLFDTPTKSPAGLLKSEPPPSFARTKFPNLNPASAFSPTPLSTTSSHLITQMCTPTISMPAIQPHTPLPLTTSSLPAAAATPPATQLTTGCTIGAVAAAASVAAGIASTAAGTTHHVSSSSPQLTPVLTEIQISRITQGAEKIARQLPQREPRTQTSKKRTTRELEQVIAMHEHDPRRMDEIRKFSAIYGRFDCKRRPEKPLTLHEVCVNEAAAQLCRLVPALLTRRDELFPLARQIIKDAGFGHSASIARYGGLLPQVMQAQQTPPRSTTVVVDCESSDSTASVSSKRPRLSSTETAAAPESGLSRESTEDSRYNLFAMYQKFAKPPFDLTDISKFSLNKPEYDDNDNDSRLSFSNSSSPSMPPSSLDNERDLTDVSKFKALASYSAPTISSSSTVMQTTCSADYMETSNHNRISPNQQQLRNQTKYNTVPSADSAMASVLSGSPLGGVQVISAAGGHIIAVANPALALSPTLNEALSLKREANSPEL